ncbi:MAG TPA: zinc dependent phospholipase C family protein [Longimicrobiales bacterium]|nr:zinc dependent phospholipase C family protein [Longimicrobiales bacterium]
MKPAAVGNSPRVAGVLLGGLLVFLVPGEAWAFGPATHTFLGSVVLDMLHLLPATLADLLRAHPQSFLYGSMAADISFAKKYVPAGRHCHFWHVGEEILDTAQNDRLRAVAYGYLSHLAADTIAHNFFVPRQLVLTSSTAALGHGYWEHRLDAQLGEPYGTLARQVVMDYDHSEADNLFDSVLSGTIFSFETNRRIFRGMVRIQDNDRWKRVFDRVLQNSRWDLTDETVDAYTSRALDYVFDYLLRGRESLPVQLDPVGDFNLQLAKKVRRLALREGVSGRADLTLLEMADDFFPLPDGRLGHWDSWHAHKHAAEK